MLQLIEYSNINSQAVLCNKVGDDENYTPAYVDKYLQHLKDNFEPIPKELDEDGFLDEEIKEKLDFLI